MKHHGSLLVLLLLLVVTSGSSGGDWEVKRQALVDELYGQGIRDSLVLAAINTVPRHAFVPEVHKNSSYSNSPLPIGHEQTISQPYIVAYMCQELNLKVSGKVLEIGTGSGYHAAVLSHLCSVVYTIEIIPELGQRASSLLGNLGYDNIHVKIGDGYQGWPEKAPFDAIILTAAPHQIPEPLLQQLKDGGRLVAPVGKHLQELVRVTRKGQFYEREQLIPVRFVPMTGEAGNPAPDSK